MKDDWLTHWNSCVSTFDCPRKETTQYTRKKYLFLKLSYIFHLLLVNLYNLGETATTTVQKPKKVLASKSSKQVSQSTSGERGTLVTTCCIESASGNTFCH